MEDGQQHHSIPEYMLLSSASPIFDEEASEKTDKTPISVVPPSQRGEALPIHDQGEPTYTA
eukprot:8880247-Ditylum_brightwellii.AAC.1